MKKILSLFIAAACICTSCVRDDDACRGNSSAAVAAKFRELFCNPDGSLKIHPVEAGSDTFVAGVRDGGRPCEIFGELIGLDCETEENYNYCFDSDDGKVSLRIEGSAAPNSEAVYATLFVDIPEYPEVRRILFVSEEYSQQNNELAATVIIVTV